MPTPKCLFPPFAAQSVGSRWIITCERDRSGAGVGTLSPAQGGLDNPRTAAWLLKNWEGSAKVFDRRKQLYEGVLGVVGAEERRGELKVGGVMRGRFFQRSPIGSRYSA